MASPTSTQESISEAVGTPGDVTGFCYCPPGWDELRLRSGPDAEAIAKIAIETFTDIAYIKEKNAIQIIGESHDEVYAAQTKLNDIFFPVIVRSKKQWARPDRPGSWGQRRDSVAAPAGSALRKMTSMTNMGGSPLAHGVDPQPSYGGYQPSGPYQQQPQYNAPQYQQPWPQQQFYSDQANRPLSQRTSVSDIKRNSFNYVQDQPISPASPFARW
ncbi:hypothetical protein HDU83_008122 [Entophlyctis luteolus]|nr:hypothetical protein HDU82_005708 [Entophlyctis luteolus]KAJ3352357.1 hypothetical protein HDU83_008122 [Entophlyctis luteolus]KAJ3391447.1 hypothetical protein HDU84_006006 [Entophlyctis sp. JEL0112]